MYTPLILKTKERIVVPCSAVVGYKIQNLKPGKLITLKRSELRCAPLRLDIPPSADQEQSWVRYLRPTCVSKIDEYLLHLWQIPALNEFYGVPFRPSINRQQHLGEAG
ncbi:MAG: hypothetical protein J0I06_06000 [Planctomycetes bacterium]|nr:hypothetical protein [Planctomycetota bacterium]